jgi:hypothetical protein
MKILFLLSVSNVYVYFKLLLRKKVSIIEMPLKHYNSGMVAEAGV